MSSAESFAVSPATVYGAPGNLSLSVLGFPTPATEVPITVPTQHNGKQNLKQLNDIGLQALNDAR